MPRLGRPSQPPAHLSVVPKPGDSFKGYDASEAYDPANYYTRSIDPKVQGDSQWRRVRFPTDITAEADRLLSSGALAGTPLTSFAALVRDALIHRLHYIASTMNDPHLNEFLANERRLSTVDSLIRDRETKARIVKDAEIALDGAIQHNDRWNATELLKMYEPMIDGMREPYGPQLDTACKKARRWLSNGR